MTPADRPQERRSRLWPLDRTVNAWWWTLDDLQHKVACWLPRPLSAVWQWAWGPFCDRVDRRFARLAPLPAAPEETTDG